MSNLAQVINENDNPKLPEEIYRLFKDRKIISETYVGKVNAPEIVRANLGHELFLVKCDTDWGDGINVAFFYKWDNGGPIKNWGWDRFSSIQNGAMAGDNLHKKRWEIYQNYLKIDKNTCKKCKQPIKERMLFLHTYVGCMC